MLYNKRWDKTHIKADPFSLESLIAWLEKQPADATYDYCISSSCLIAQYLQACGVEEFDIESPMLSERPEIQDFGRIANGGQPVDTFGAALDRARKMLAQR
jgi:hypothetical protein